VLLERFDAARMLELISRHRVTVLLQVPAILHALTLQPDFEGLRDSSLRLIIWGGGRASLALLHRLQGLGVSLRGVYGQTETLSVGCVSDPQATLETLSSSVGRPAPGLQMRVVGENGLPCAALEVGELQVKASFLMLGYWQEPQATLNAFTSDGWLRTGDLVSIDSDGLLRLVGRRSDMIKSGGYNLYPRELEEALEMHPAIALAAVIGVPNEQYGEVAIAYFEPRAGAVIDESELRVWLRERLANFKIPKRFVALEQLPLLPNGKLDKLRLRALEVNS
jgi:acyl-CoA synthetase (AMP-forming)/AMP-acid ligase II